MDIDESIKLEEYNSAWPELFREEESHLTSLLGQASISIEHIGSTAIPGLIAKPIIDILIGVDSQTFQYPQAFLEALAYLGYENCGEAGVPGRLYFRKRGDISFNLHAVIYNSEIWTNNLLLRDYLRRHPDEARLYGEHKRHLLKQGINRLLPYSKSKHALIEQLLDRAKKENLK